MNFSLHSINYWNNNPPPPGTEFDYVESASVQPEIEENFAAEEKNTVVESATESIKQENLEKSENSYNRECSAQRERSSPRERSSQRERDRSNEKSRRYRSRSRSSDRKRYRRRSRSRSRNRRSRGKRRRSRSRSRSYSRSRSNDKRKKSRSRTRKRKYSDESRSRSRSSDRYRYKKSHRKRAARSHSKSRSRSKSKSDISRSHNVESPKSPLPSSQEEAYDEGEYSECYNPEPLTSEIMFEQQEQIPDNNPIPFKNDGSFLEMFKRMQEMQQQQQIKEEPADVSQPKKPTLPTFGKRRGGKVLKTGLVQKIRNVEDDPSTAGDPWSVYMKEVRKYKEVHCDDDSKTRPLVK